jgi:uncharacterized protein (TIGR01777 family)
MSPPASHQLFRRTLRLPVPVETLFAWHERPGAFLRLSPPWDQPRVLEHTGGIRDGARVVLEVRAGPVPTRWVLEHRDYVENRRFRDVMQSGPFSHWVHTHEFAPDGPDASLLDDQIEYALPLGGLGDAVAGGFVRETLERVFRYRHAVLTADIERHAEFADRPRLTVAITGATGFIGSQLAAFLSTGGHRVLRIGRGAVRPGVVDISWDPSSGRLDAASLEGVDAVIHLAGASIADRWTASHRRAIRDSRIEGTSLLAHTLAGLSRRPRALLSGSAIGVYGSRGDELLDEASRFGAGYLAEVGRDWEAATAPAERAGIRVAHLRTGIVMGAAGGALAKQLPLFRIGAGGKLGSGAQWLSPIALDDVIGAIHWVLMRDDLRGAVNLVAPEAVTNAEFTRVLAGVLHRPALATVPAFALRLALGAEMANETVLASQRVRPGALLASGFRFRLPGLEQMLRFELGVWE